MLGPIQPSRCRSPSAVSGLLSEAVGGYREIGRIEIIFAGNADQREQRIAPGIGQGRPHPARGRGLGYGTDRPIRGDPFP